MTTQILASNNLHQIYNNLFEVKKIQLHPNIAMQLTELNKPIGIDTQIENVLFGQSSEEKNRVDTKCRYVRDNIDKVISINGKKVYNPILVYSETLERYDIHYNLHKCPEQFLHLLKDSENRIYYYPVQYAEIEYLQTSHGKRYYQTDRVGMCKYTVSHHDGVKTHKDGSPFYDIAIFKNKIKLRKFISDLHQQGYKLTAD